jgi:hypothetical protein
MGGKITDIEDMLYYTKTVINMDKTEKFLYLQRETKGNKLKDKHTVTPNKIFETILHSPNVICLKLHRPSNHPSRYVIRQI